MSMPPPPPPPSGPLPGMPVPIVPTAPSATGTPGARGSRRTWLVVAGLVAVVGLVAVAIVTVFGGDDDDGVDTSAALAAIEGFDDTLADDVDAAQADDTSLYIDLDECPVGDLDDLLDLAPADLSLPDVDAGDASSYAVTIDDSDAGSDPLAYGCLAGAGDDDDSFVGTIVGRSSDREHRRYVDRSLTLFDVDFIDDREHRGGVITTYCAVAADDEDAEFLSPFCEADWVGGGVQVGVFATIDPDEVDLMQEFTIAALDHLLDEVADHGDLDLPDES